MVFELPLVDLSGGVLDFLDVAHELAIGSVDVLLEEGLDDAGLFLQQLLADISAHNDHYY